jgi:HIRAN domain
MNTWRTRVVGVTFPNADGGDRQAIVRTLRPGDSVTLRREFSNDHDPNAVAVIADAGQIGYVPAKVAEVIVRSGFHSEAVVTEVRGGTAHAPTFGCEITIQVGRNDP